MRGCKALVLVVALSIGAACSLILDFGLEVECWCGERWKVQISGAHAFVIGGGSHPIPASDTTYETCVTQLEHLALDTADPDDPLFLAIRDNLESGALAQCEAAGVALGTPFFSHTDCAAVGTEPVVANIVHLGPCWQVETYGENYDPADRCALGSDSECVGYYDCSDQPIWNENLGDDEAGEDALLWECDDPIAGSELAIESERQLPR